MKIKELVIYLLAISFNLLFGFLLTPLLFNTNKYFTFVTCGIIILSTLVIYIISNKFNYKLDVLAYNISEFKHLVLNSIFIGNLFSIPITIFVSMIL